MKILAISDVESKSLWEFYTPEKLQGVDLVLSCGDLDPRYLSFLATFTPAPVLYVHLSLIHISASTFWRWP